MGYRIEKVANVIRDVVSDAIANRLSDPRISPFASVTRVEVSGDMQHARVYISVMGTSADQRTTLAGLANAAGHVQKLLGKKLRMRHCPRIDFVSDDAIKKGDETLRVINAVMRTNEPDDVTDRSDEVPDGPDDVVTGGPDDDVEAPLPEITP
jgi:ribosome-binding factor A